MKMEILDLNPTEQRVLLLFDSDVQSPNDQEVDDYLHAHDLEPRRQYWDTRDGKEYLVYYFGHCYLEDHLEQLSVMASEAPQPQS